MAKLTPVVLDLETFWSQTHTLSKMNPITYCVHPETEIISCAAKVGNEPTYVTFGEDAIRKQTKKFDWSDKIVIGHNLSLFDSMILRWRLGVKPAMWACTLAMARPLHGLTVGGSLAKLVAHYAKELEAMGVKSVKDQTALINTKGRHLKDFTPEEIEAMREYNKNDVEQCAALFKILFPLTPKKEMKIIDGTIRMLVEPKFRLDVPLLEKTLTEERERKHLMLLDTATMIGADVFGKTDEEIADEISKTLGSANKFAKLLKDLGVAPPMKPSPTNPEKQTYALAKTDEEFVALTTHQDPIIAAAANARLGVKSTLLETRIEAFLDVAAVTGGRMPIAKNYYGAHTGRFSGAFGLNQENLPRIPRDKQGNIIDKPTNALRLCLTAPKGHKVVVADLSGIELRVNHFLWQVPSSMALFEADPEKADLYKDFASKLYNVPVDQVSKEQRQIGKVAHLGLGFSAGAKTFVRIAKMMGGVDITEDESQKIVTQWREAYAEIVRGWKTCGQSLHAIHQGASFEVDPWGLVVTDSEGYVLPSGRKIRYPQLRQVTSEGKTSWKYGEGRNETFLSPGKCDENIVQALARDILMDNALEIKRLTGYYPCHTVHDELIFVVPEEEAKGMLDTVQSVMRTPPSWFPALKTWSEGDIADTYGAAK